MAKAHSLEDREYLNTLSTKHLRKLLDNTRRRRSPAPMFVISEKVDRF